MWLAAVAFAETVREAFPPPAGARRVAADAFGEHVRDLPLLPPGTPVRAYDGRVIEMYAARVVDLPLPKVDLQQCADSILRVRAEWERAQGRSPAFHYTSGQLSRWSAWGGSWESWLLDLFTYAGTRSLPLDTVADTEPSPGDLLVTPGSPGHAVLLLDVATDGRDTWVLAGQGYMPAMSFHVASPGWRRVEGDRLVVWPLPMPWSGLRRWKG
ncbi:MAG: DUF4846 domain-containing protein [Myxococcota bacterium]